MYFLLKKVNFHRHVSLLEGIPFSGNWCHVSKFGSNFQIRHQLRPFWEAMSWRRPVDPVFFFASGGSTSGNTLSPETGVVMRETFLRKKISEACICFFFCSFQMGRIIEKEVFIFTVIKVKCSLSIYLLYILQFVRYQSLFEKNKPYS